MEQKYGKMKISKKNFLSVNFQINFYAKPIKIFFLHGLKTSKTSEKLILYLIL